jgi:hypothetical protein
MKLRGNQVYMLKVMALEVGDERGKVGYGIDCPTVEVNSTVWDAIGAKNCPSFLMKDTRRYPDFQRGVALSKLGGEDFSL